MAGGFQVLFMFLVLMLNGGGRDLLHMIPTEAYWQEKNVEMTTENMLAQLGGGAEQAPDISDLAKQLASDDHRSRRQAKEALIAMGPAITPQLEKLMKESQDPEVVNSAREVMESFGGVGKAKEVRKLMAIRALGDLKAKEALPTLEKLVDSKELFVAEYAKDAIARIKGEQPQLPQATAEQLKSDYLLLPKNMGTVAQAKSMVAGTTAVEELAKLNSGMMRRFSSTQPTTQMDEAQKKQAMREYVQTVIRIAEQTGNARLDSMTMGISDDVGPRTGYIVFIARGKYDPEGLATLKSSLSPRMEKQVIEGLDVYADREATILPLSSERLVFAVGSNADSVPVMTIAKHLKAGKGELDQNQTMMDLIKTVDTTKPAWGVMQINAAMAEAPFLAPFDTVRMTADVKDDEVIATFKAEGDDAEEVKKAVEWLNTEIGREVTRMKERIAQNPNGYWGRMKPMVDIMESIKATADGKTATLTGKARGGIGAFINAIR